MRGILASIEDGVAQAADFVVHLELGSDAEVANFSGEHVIEVLKILLESIILAAF